MKTDSIPKSGNTDITEQNQRMNKLNLRERLQALAFACSHRCKSQPPDQRTFGVPRLPRGCSRPRPRPRWERLSNWRTCAGAPAPSWGPAEGRTAGSTRSASALLLNRAAPSGPWCERRRLWGWYHRSVLTEWWFCLLRLRLWHGERDKVAGIVSTKWLLSLVCENYVVV